MNLVRKVIASIRGDGRDRDGTAAAAVRDYELLLTRMGTFTGLMLEFDTRTFCHTMDNYTFPNIVALSFKLVGKRHKFGPGLVHFDALTRGMPNLRVLDIQLGARQHCFNAVRQILNIPKLDYLSVTYGNTKSSLLSSSSNFINVEQMLALTDLVQRYGIKELHVPLDRRAADANRSPVIHQNYFTPDELIYMKRVEIFQKMLNTL